MTSPFVTIDTVADYFNVSKSTIRNWVKSGVIPTGTYIRLGNTFRFKLDDIESHLTTSSNVVQIKEEPETIRDLFDEWDEDEDKPTVDPDEDM